MANYVVSDTSLTAVADAIREKTGTSEQLVFPSEFISEIEGLAGNSDEIKVADWIRPQDAPNLDKITLSNNEDVIYMTYDVQQIDLNFCLLRFQGAYQVEIGTVNNGTFTSFDSAESVNSNTIYFKDLSNYKNDYNYIVIKVTGTITKIDIYNQSYTDNVTGKKYSSSVQPIIEIYCSLPNLTNASSSFRALYNVERIYIANLNPTSIDNMFRESINLKQVDKKNWNTNNLTACGWVFYGDILLSKFNAEELVSSATTNISFLFYDCKSIQQVDTTGWDTKNIITSNEAFRNCASLLKIIGIENFNTEKITRMDNMFRGCQKLTLLNISSWNTDSVTNISYMFGDCHNLRSLDISNWNVENVTNFSYTFSSCYELYSLDISDWDTSSATTTSNMFYNCRSLHWLDVSNLDMDSVTNISNMFNGSYFLQEIDISNWNLSLVTDSTSFMQNCTRPSSLIIPSTLSILGNNSFNYINGTLSEYHFLSTTPPNLNNTNALKGDTPIYVPYSADHSVLNAYKTATNWSSFASYIQEEES